MRNAITNCRQPLESASGNSFSFLCCVIGFEALARWIHPQRGSIPPTDFIPVAEDTGLILLLGEWVLREACRQLRVWDQVCPNTRLMVSVNLSAKQLEQKDLVELVESILQESGLEPSRLKLEITESVLMSNAEQSIVLIQQLRELGICISIDDFGTGYSSLSYLHRFPIDTLKVDRSFVSGLSSAGVNTEIVQTIIMLAHNLGIDVIAEGVETNEQLAQLQQMNCGFGKGYFYSKPLDHQRAAELIKTLAPPTCEVSAPNTAVEAVRSGL
ncbi:MAG TPA: EAL domain-containing protein [Blastocatellia bacterium]|nr:EAL domain-containing protein [Blastocatellia bacterium]